MEQTKYIQTPPAGMFAVRIERIVRHDTRDKMHYEYTYTVDLRPTACDFVAQFAGLVVALGKSPAVVFAARMGVSERQLVVTLATLTGAGVREWCDTFACAVSEALLRDTDWSIERVAKAAGFDSVSLFSHFWRKKYQCAPRRWRWRAMKSTGGHAPLQHAAIGAGEDTAAP